MKVRMQKLNLVKYADSEARVKALEQEGYKKSPVPAKKGNRAGADGTGERAGGKAGEGND